MGSELLASSSLSDIATEEGEVSDKPARSVVSENSDCRGGTEGHSKVQVLQLCALCPARPGN